MKVLYIDRGPLLAHVYVRRDGEGSLRWGYTLWVGKRTLLFGGRRSRGDVS